MKQTKALQQLEHLERQELHSSETLQQYLRFMGYHATYWRGYYRGFYNPRNRKTVLVPDTATVLSKDDVLALFAKDGATDLSPIMEWSNLQRFTRVKDVISPKTN